MLKFDIREPFNVRNPNIALNVLKKIQYLCYLSFLTLKDDI